MISKETDLLPDAQFYKLGVNVIDPLFQAAGGYGAHNLDAFRQVEDEPFLLLPNHRAGSNPFSIGLVSWRLPELTAELPDGPIKSRRLVYMAKRELWTMPVVGSIVGPTIQRWGAFPVERYTGRGLDEEQNSYIGQLVAQKAALLIFMEGTRRDEEHVQLDKMYSGAAVTALKEGIKVMPTGIADLGKKLFGVISTFKLPSEIVFGDAISVGQSEHDVKSDAFRMERDDLKAEIHGQMDARYQEAKLYLAERMADRSIEKYHYDKLIKNVSQNVHSAIHGRGYDRCNDLRYDSN
jgi:1-acyl-sn-glycerol-3-phosphate acyltransferase